MYIVKTYLLDLIRWNITALKERCDKIRRVLEKAQLGPAQTERMLAIIDSDAEKIIEAENFYEEVRTTADPSDEQMDQWCTKVQNLR